MYLFMTIINERKLIVNILILNLFILIYNKVFDSLKMRWSNRNIIHRFERVNKLFYIYGDAEEKRVSVWNENKEIVNIISFF